MSPKKTYVARYERDPDDDAWNVSIDGLDGCQTYGRSLHQAHNRIREALALWLDREPDKLAIRDEFPNDLVEVAQSAIQARDEADRAGSEAQRRAAAAVKALTAKGLSRRDAAELLGLSHQRVQQLLRAT